MRELEENWQDLIHRNSQAAHDLAQRVGFMKPKEANIDILSEAEKDKRAKIQAIRMKRDTKEREAQRKAIKDKSDAKLIMEEKHRKEQILLLEAQKKAELKLKREQFLVDSEKRKMLPPLTYNNDG